jgi:hypothetical protein
MDEERLDEASPRFALPFIIPGQAQKEWFHNKALAALDAALHPVVEGAPTSIPPDAPADGRAWLVGNGPAGPWQGRAGAIAAWTAGGWRFVRPQEGMCVWDRSSAFHRRWTGSAWTEGEVAASKVVIAGAQVVGSRQSAVPSPSGGTIIDAEAQSAIAALTVALQTHGLID